MDITVATWNTQWRTPDSDAGRRIAGILAGTEADVIVVTEGVRELLPAGGYAVDAGGDWGYGVQPSRRKVIIWSRYPLTLDFVGTEGGTCGRLAVATVAAQSGPVRIIGVCIPWQDAHVRTGRHDAQPWSEHLNFLDHLEAMMPTLDGGIPAVIAGDFNQRIPRGRQPIRVATRLDEVLAGWTIHTAGALPNGPHIDHIATNGRLGLGAVSDWARSDHLGNLSDHAGVHCRLVSGEFADVPRQPIAAAAPARVPEPQVPVPEPALRQPPQRGGSGALPPEMLAEIEHVLRNSGSGLSHGATFQLREQGLDAAEIAAERGVSLQTTNGFLKSLDALLTGEVPTTKSLALTNSYVYRELLNHARSSALDSYVMAQLRRLKDINPEVTFGPLQTRPYQYRVGKRNG